MISQQDIGVVLAACSEYFAALDSELKKASGMSVHDDGNNLKRCNGLRTAYLVTRKNYDHLVEVVESGSAEDILDALLPIPGDAKSFESAGFYPDQYPNLYSAMQRLIRAKGNLLRKINN